MTADNETPRLPDGYETWNDVIKAGLAAGIEAQAELSALRARVAELEKERQHFDSLMGEITGRLHDYVAVSPFNDGSEARVKELEAERDTLRAELDYEMEAVAHECRNEQRRLKSAEAEVARLRLGIEQALNELGVPHHGYPAPVAAAVCHLRSALAPPPQADGGSA